LNTTLIVVAVCLVVVGWGLAWFFGTELQKKFAFMGRFVNGTQALVTYKYPGAAAMGISKGMRNLVLRSSDGKPFRTLVAFKFEFAVIGQLGSVDPYGFVASNKDGVAVVSTYLGKGSVDFTFLVIKDDGSTTAVTVSSTDEDQRLLADVAYPPHWIQKHGFWA
jgi:hypothetical protein